MATSAKLKEAFEAESKYSAFYTGGNVEWFEDTLFCQTSANISLLNTGNGVVERVVGEENSEDADFIQTFTTDGQRIVSSHKSGLLKLWNRNGEIEKQWKYIHKGPIAKLVLRDSKLASGGSDSSIRLWDLQYQSCTSNLKFCQGVINVVEFHPIENIIFGSGDDGKICCYDSVSGELMHQYNAHYSKVSALVIANDNKHFISSGRDKVIVLWELGKTVALKVIPTYEAIEVVITMPMKFKLPGYKSDPDNIYVASVGEKGLVKVWDVLKAKVVFTQSDSLVTPAQEDGGLAVSHMRFNEKMGAIALVTVEQNILIYHLKSLACLKQFIGFTDEILDIAFVGKNESHIAVATNSNDIKLYDNTTMDCKLLKAHTDIVLAVCASKTDPNLMLSSGKDNTLRLWLMEGSTMSCIAVGQRHTGSVGSVAFSQTSTKFAVSVSEDTCLKCWEIPSKPGKQVTLECLYTEVAHDKDINCVAVSPNDKIIATASQDKTAKLWTDSLTLVGVLRGHKRGVWSIRFSPVDQVVLTSSADCSIKLWSVADLSCLKSFEGHDASVLRAEFVASGMQILTAGADGLLKLFSVKSSECVCTLDQHEARVWAVAIKADESGLVTGGSDSVLIKWKDITEELKHERIKAKEELAMEEQKLSNYLHNENYLKALKLALKLEKPFQALKIVEKLIKQGSSGLGDTVKSLRNDQKENLFKMAVDWNTNSRNCHPAQIIINVLLNELHSEDFRPVGLQSLLEGTLPYTERHFKRLTQQMQDLNFLTYTLHCMKPVSSNKFIES